MAKVSETLNLPCYIDYDTALKVTNKEYMKDVFQKNNIPTARYISLDKYDSEAIKHLRYPMVVKPTDCNSSKGVKRVNNAKELEIAFKEAINLSRSRTVIIEEFVKGDEVSVDAYVKNGKAHVLAVSISEKIRDSEKFVIFRALYPILHGKEVSEQIQKIAQQIADAFGLIDSPLLIQTLCDGSNVHVVEFSARTGGGVKYKLIKRISGFDVISAVVDLTLGNSPDVIVQPAESNYISNEFIYCYPGVFDRIDGFSKLKDDGIITIEYTEVRNFAQGEEEWARHRDSATMDVA